LQSDWSRSRRRVLARSKSRMASAAAGSCCASHPASRAPVSIPDVIRGPGRVLPPVVKDLRPGRGAQAADTPVTAPQIHGVLDAGAPQTAHAVWRTSGSTAFAAPPWRGRPSQPLLGVDGLRSPVFKARPWHAQRRSRHRPAQRSRSPASLAARWRPPRP
jgi:hypothetical protein